MAISKTISNCVSGIRTLRRFYDVAAAVPITNVSEQPQLTEEGLSDAFARKHDYLRISLTEKCNLRCKYCMPAEGVTLSPRERLLTTAETMKLARVFAALGVRSIRLTGGEPSLRKDLEQIIRQLKSIAGIEKVSMTTNGLTLTRILPALQRAGLDALNISLDSLRPERYETLARRPGSNLKRVLAGIDLAIQLGYKPVKINTVLMKGINDDEIFDFVEMTRDKEVEVRFIEFMPFAGNEWAGAALVPARVVLRSLATKYELTPAHTQPSSTSLVWTVGGHKGRFGMVASMTQPFCRGCNRLRLTADGQLKVCLFGGEEGDLRSAMRSGASEEELKKQIRQALMGKKFQHAGGYGKLGSNEKSSNDFNRRLTKFNCIAKRNYCTGLKSYNDNNILKSSAKENGKNDENVSFSHVDNTGKARMVDIGEKPTTKRIAKASCFLTANPTVLKLLREHKIKKGDAIAVAEVAGVMAAKRTAELIPLCHSLPLDSIKVNITLPKDGDKILIECTAQCSGKTGVEMEALTGASMAALTLYDMCKAVDKRMVISDLKVQRKSGGRNDFCLT